MSKNGSESERKHGVLTLCHSFHLYLYAHKVFARGTNVRSLRECPEAERESEKSVSSDPWCNLVETRWPRAHAGETATHHHERHEARWKKAFLDVAFHIPVGRLLKQAGATQHCCWSMKVRQRAKLIVHALNAHSSPPSLLFHPVSVRFISVAGTVGRLRGGEADGFLRPVPYRCGGLRGKNICSPRPNCGREEESFLGKQKSFLLCYRRRVPYFARVLVMLLLLC